MKESSFDRRTLLRGALAGLASLPAVGLLRSAPAEAAEPTKVDEKEPQAVALAYVHDAKKVDASKNPQYKAGQNCANCLQLVGKEGDEWRPCNIFAGRLVHKDGWCKVWVQKPGTKL